MFWFIKTNMMTEVDNREYLCDVCQKQIIIDPIEFQGNCYHVTCWLKRSRQCAGCEQIFTNMDEIFTFQDNFYHLVCVLREKNCPIKSFI